MNRRIAKKITKEFQKDTYFRRYTLQQVHTAMRKTVGGDKLPTFQRLMDDAKARAVADLWTPPSEASPPVQDKYDEIRYFTMADPTFNEAAAEFLAGDKTAADTALVLDEAYRKHQKFWRAPAPRGTEPWTYSNACPKCGCAYPCECNRRTIKIRLLR